jgi:SpoOM protein
MFGKVKKWLGIEGVKLELILPEEISRKSSKVNGLLKFTSMNDQTVTYIKVVMVEKFSRGRGEEKLIDEYELGAIELTKEFDVPANEPIEIEFELPFDLMKSEMDEMQDKNMLLGGIVKTVKWMSRVKSEFRIIAEAKVRGVALDPFDKKTISIE